MIQTVDQCFDRGTLWLSTLKTTITTVCRFGFSALVLVFSVGFSSFPGAGDVWFSLRGTTYQNNSCVTLEDIGEGNDALLCITNLSACCKRDGSALGNWFFPNGTKVPSNGIWWDFFYRTRGQMKLSLNHIGGGVSGIYSCEIPDSMNITQTMYIGLYTASTGT